VSDVKPLKGKVEMVSGVVRRGGKTSRLVVAAVPQKGKQKSVYRLVMQAATDDFAAADKGFLSTAKSLTGLTKAQAGRLKPLRIKVETVGNGQDMVYFVKKMRGVKLPERTFRVLNNVPTGNRLEPGRRVKIVTDYVKF
jgi:predicted Zn-dependent protease